MTHPINLKQLERKAFRSTFSDGLWDIYLGTIFFAFGAGFLSRNLLGLSTGGATSIHIGLIAVALPLLIAAKRLITVPRLGYVQFGAERQRKLGRTRMVLAGSVLLGVVTLLIIGVGWLGLGGLSVLFGLAVLLVLGLIAFYMDYYRLYLYAGLWAISMPLGLLLEQQGVLRDAPVIFVYTGGVAMLVGGILLVQFLRHYKPGEEC